MKYYIQRQLNEYGPYTLADLQRYVAQGSIQLADLTRSEGMTDWVPLSQVIGNIPIPVAAPPMQPGIPVYGGGGIYGPEGGYAANGTVYSPLATPAATTGLMPPDFHWALVLLIGFFCGIFQIIWLFIEAGFVKKIDPESKGIPLLVGGLLSPVIGYFALIGAAWAGDRNGPALGALIPFFLLVITGIVFHLMAVFQMRSSLEDYYNTVEPINLRLSGVMTFFFAVYYFQYHFTRIANWKKTGYLQPQ
jgi:hypothetical protein